MLDKEHLPTVAAFDFDGTITYRDSLVYFLLFAKGYFKAALLVLRTLPTLVLFVLGRKDRQAAKEALLTNAFAGMPLSELEALGKAFAAAELPRHVRPEALARIKWHQKMGHRLVLVSASIETYLIPWCQAAGFHDTVASRLALDPAGHVTGKLLGLNCRREEKVRRLIELLGPLDQYNLYAYGDSDGDKELLESADLSFYRMMPSDT